MVKTIKIIKSDSKWHLEFNGKKYPISADDYKVIEALKPDDNQICIITDVSNIDAVCYFIKENGRLKVFSYPEEVIYVDTSVNLQFFKNLEEEVKYYLIPIR